LVNSGTPTEAEIYKIEIFKISLFTAAVLAAVSFLQAMHPGRTLAMNVG
jgi:hypothetical protein